MARLVYQQSLRLPSGPTSSTSFTPTCPRTKDSHTLCLTKQVTKPVPSPGEPVVPLHVFPVSEVVELIVQAKQLMETYPEIKNIVVIVADP